MPKNVSIPREITRVQKLIDENNIEKQQIVTRLIPSTYLLHLQDCARVGKVPGPRAAEVLTEYYMHWSLGVHLSLPDNLRNVVDQIARLTGVDREIVVLRILEQFAAQVLDETVKSQRVLEQSLSLARNLPNLTTRPQQSANNNGHAMLSS